MNLVPQFDNMDLCPKFLSLVLYSKCLAKFYKVCSNVPTLRINFKSEMQVVARWVEISWNGEINGF